MNIAIIPARGGSRRIPNKNIREFHGKPIIAHSIETALASGLFDAGVWVSTEDEEIANIASRYGAGCIRRNSEFSDDNVGTQEVMRHALETMRREDEQEALVLRKVPKFPEYACCLYATAPMLKPHVLGSALSLLAMGGCDYVVPVSTWLRDPGQFYFGRTEAFMLGRPLLGVDTIMLPISPDTDCDINTMDDWVRAEEMYVRLVANDALIRIGSTT